ncbi:unnamed protein product [Adineta ricciae]|uniref:NAD(P)(+)--arginine ADP-ribosyltransferase n=1 Tax=Adineta ricciae TaxID=249248 RepID=A0A815EBR1_ADIRI|nr:unnamed protein product [Adineta ricciae]
MEYTQHTTNRFVDIKFYEEKLSPVCGYWNEKLIPLEEALKFLRSRMNELQKYIETAKNNCHFPSEHGLTHDESAALFLYATEENVNSLNRMLNQTLRSSDRSSVKPWFPYLKLLDTAVAKLPTVRKNVWRAVINDVDRDFKKGEEFTWWTVTSCSLSMDTVANHLPSESKITLILIEAIHGKYISGYTEHPDEGEVLLMPGTELRVVSDSLDYSDSIKIIHLMEISEDNDEQLPSAIAIMKASSQTEGSQEQQRQSHKSGLICGGRPLTYSICT